MFSAATEALVGVVDDSDVVDALTEPLSESREALQWTLKFSGQILGQISDQNWGQFSGQFLSPQYSYLSNLSI